MLLLSLNLHINMFIVLLSTPVPAIHAVFRPGCLPYCCFLLLPLFFWFALVAPAGFPGVCEVYQVYMGPAVASLVIIFFFISTSLQFLNDFSLCFSSLPRFLDLRVSFLQLFHHVSVVTFFFAIFCDFILMTYLSSEDVFLILIGALFA